MSRTAAFVALWRALRTRHRGGPGLGARLQALPRMTAASLRRQRRSDGSRYDGARYDGLWRIGLMALAMLYLAWPVELMPELLLGPVGLIDDVVVLTWLAGAVLSETGRFLEWEGRRAARLPAQPSAQPPGQPSNQLADAGRST